MAANDQNTVVQHGTKLRKIQSILRGLNSYTQRGAGGEIQLTDAIASLLKEQDVIAYEFDGIRYDCGSKLGHMKANVEYALRHPDLNGEFRKYLQSLEVSA